MGSGSNLRRNKMEKVDILLSDKFVEFSQKIAVIFQKKKDKKAELKEFYERIQADIEELNQEAKALQEEFEQWKEENE
jgi:hypothetical protein